MIGRQLAHFRITGKLGEGGMGEVYRAEDTRLGREVALKILPSGAAGDGERLARFEREARAVAALNHPNIVTLFSVEEDAGVAFYVMELVPGRTLAEEIPAGGMELGRFWEAAVPLADALAAAHQRGLVHRDLKPGNVMVRDDGRVKVLDFGLAKLVGGEEGSPSPEASTELVTRAGAALGTVPYMAPEQVTGRPVDERTDLFALGVVLYEMASGRRPFVGGSAGEVFSAILRDAPPPLGEARPGVSPGLAELVHRCLQKEPEWRPGSAAEVRDRLAELAREQAVQRRDRPSSIAVLPFADMSPQKDQDYFCEGMAEEIIGRLAKLEGLHVASRTASFQFQGAADMAAIGERLRVESVLEGSVRKAGSRLRVTAQLIEVAGGFHLWSETYDRELEDVFAIQDEIAESVAAALRLILTPRERQAIQRPPARSLEAYEQYLRGRRLFHDYGRRVLKQSRALFERAAELDPGYALAHAGIADASSTLHLYFETLPEHAERAERASRRALELAPDLAEAHVSRALALSLNGRHDEAEKEYETALRLDPKLFDGYYLYARDAVLQGKMEKAARLFEEAARMRPEDAQALLLVMQVYRTFVGEASAARRGLERAQRHLELNPGDARILYLGAGAWVVLGDPEEGRRWAARALALDADEPAVNYNLGCFYSLVGDLERALDCLEAGARGSYGTRQWMEHDSDLDPLRGHPRFEAILDSLRQG
ncbi:MAG TPA: protein kinase [Thermoanaerobaculia bacterium]|nr:protein kinase [Thermoanaerobaculia bacterium]